MENSPLNLETIKDLMEIHHDRILSDEKSSDELDKKNDLIERFKEMMMSELRNL